MASKEGHHEPLFMRAAVFISGSVLLGLLFALQDWFSMHHMGYPMKPFLVFEAWGSQFFLLGAMCWLVWRLGRNQIEHASLASCLALFLPLSLLIGILEVMIWVVLFPELPINRPEMSYRDRLTFNLYGDLFENVVIFWCAFFLFRGVSYYTRYREKEQAASQLRVELANAQISALRMQMNPHFLFNTMNSISSLMRTDIDAADRMLEQLSSLMRITLERGNAQLISLRDELDFVELFLEMQAHRYQGRVTQTVIVDPELYDAEVPAMVLQPIVENAYVHGISQLESHGVLSLEIDRDGDQIRIRVTNSRPGPRAAERASTRGHGVGLANIKNRLKLHYGDNASFSFEDQKTGQVQVTILLPLQLSQEPGVSLARYMVQ